MIRRHPVQLQAVYSELLSRTRQAEWERLVDKQGSFAHKTVKGRRYWYFRRRIGNKVKETYLGPETDDLLDRIQSDRVESEGAKAAAAERRKLVRQLRAGGYVTPDARSGRVLQALARAGVFRLRAVLVGTHAYRAYGAMLGAALAEEAALTSDIDIAQFTTISLAVGDRIEPSFQDVIDDIERFIAVPNLRRTPTTSAWRTADQSISVELLTPMVGPSEDDPIALPALGAHARPLRFLDYLIHECEPAVVLHGDGVLVNVPVPERFACHKLIVAQRRQRHARDKALKDIGQAAALFEVLLEDRPDDVTDAWQDLVSRGPRWQTLAVEGAKRLPYEIAAQLLATEG